MPKNDKKTISVAFESENKSTWLSLPATAEELNKALLDISALDKQYAITACRTPLDISLDKVVVGGNINEVNYLAARLSELPQVQLDKLAAVVETPEALPTIAEMIDFTYNTDFYVLIPGVYSPVQLGEYYLEDTEMVQMPEEWIGAIDVEMLGELAVKNEGGVFTNNGYLLPSGDQWQEVFEKTRIVPEQYRVDNNMMNATMDVQIEIDRLKNAGVRVEVISKELDYRDNAGDDARWDDNLFEYDSDELHQIEAVWTEQENYLKNAEVSTEQNYNQIDGLINNEGPRGADLTDGQTHDEIEELAPETLRRDEKPSILGELKKAQENIAKPDGKGEKKPHDLDL